MIRIGFPRPDIEHVTNYASYIKDLIQRHADEKMVFYAGDDGLVYHRALSVAIF